MKKNNDHPEVQDVKNICDISPDSDKSNPVCNQVNEDKDKKPSKKEEDKLLDETLEDSFPASDPPSYGEFDKK